MHVISMPTSRQGKPPFSLAGGQFFLAREGEGGGSTGDRMAAQMSVKGKNRAVRIAPTAIPANMNVTAVGRSYSGRVRLWVAMLYDVDSLDL